MSVTNARDEILNTIRQAPGCSIDDLLRRCPNLGWNQVFFELDRLSREGQVLLTDMGHGRYAMWTVETAACETATRTALSFPTSEEERL